MVMRLLIAACGTLAILALGYFGALGGGRSGAGVAYDIQAELQQRAQAALTERELDWASVRVDGQFAILEGEAPREEERDNARAAVLSAQGPGGFWRGGIVSVDDRSTLAPPMDPYVFTAEREGERVTLDGAAPSRAARADLTTYAQQLFPGGVIDNLTIARGAPDDLAWETAARIAVTQLANLASGRVVMTDQRIVVEGVADGRVAMDRIEQDTASLPTLFDAQLRVEAPAMEAEVIAGGPLEEPEVELISSREECEARLLAVLRESGVEFREESLVLEKESYPILDQLASIARRCEAMRIMVVGQVSAGLDEPAELEAADLPLRVDEDMMTLWRGRAQAIADYLVLKGVALDHAVADAEATAQSVSRVTVRVVQ